MNLLDRITSFFRHEQPSLPSKLRNKPGGMAWIVGLPNNNGEEALNGRAVRTERMHEDGFWDIEPVQEWVCTQNTWFAGDGAMTRKGEIAKTVGVRDSNLQPWKDLGSDAQDESLWASPPREPLHLPVKEM